MAQDKRKWRHADLTKEQKDRFPWNQQAVDLSRMPTSPVELFEIFFDQEVLEIITEFSKMYARSKGNMAFSTTPEELQTFLAILLLSGYSPVLRRRMYWSSEEDVSKEAVQSAMSRNRFEELMRYLHVKDNSSLDIEDRMSKVRPLMTFLNEKFSYLLQSFPDTKSKHRRKARCQTIYSGQVNQVRIHDVAAYHLSRLRSSV